MKINVGENIRRARVAKGITQAELAQKLGVIQQQVSRWEAGSASHTVETLIAVAEALGVNPKDLLS